MPYSKKKYGAKAAKIKQKAAGLRYYHRLRQATIAAYGGKCACCGESEYEFLQLDHVNNDGAAHRRKLNCRDGFGVYRDLARRGYPDGFQVLCANCHLAKSKGVVCPHKR